MKHCRPSLERDKLDGDNSAQPHMNATSCKQRWPEAIVIVASLLNLWAGGGGDQCGVKVNYPPAVVISSEIL